MYLYKLINKINFKGYIGISVNPVSHRVSRHKYAAKCDRKDSAIAQAIRKYGIENFIVEHLAVAGTYEELLALEAQAIIDHGTLRPAGYNITSGGRGARRPCSRETKLKISAKIKGRTPWNKGKKTGAFHRSWCLGKKLGPAWNRGIKCTPEHRLKLIGRTPWNKGKKTGPMPEEQKLQIAATMRLVRAMSPWSTRPNSIQGEKKR